MSAPLPAGPLREWRQIGNLLTRGRSHGRRLSEIDVRIAVTGTRGKSTVTRWLHDVFVERGYDTYAKVTGDAPISLYNGREYPIERHGPIRLYENEREIRTFEPTEVLIVENQGIREYTMRLVNTRYVRPNVVVLTNVRQDHLDTLGGDRFKIARAFARSIPSGAHVISGEVDEEINDYLEVELGRRNAMVSRATIPEEYALVPGAENVFLVDGVLRAIGELPLDERRIARYLDRLEVSWTELPEGRVFDASDTNDVESMERIRSALEPKDEVIQPLVYLRHDRPGRTASYLEYLNGLAERGIVEQTHVVGSHRMAFARGARFPVVDHDQSVESVTDVLDAALADGSPVVLMANGVPTFMQDIKAELRARVRRLDERPVLDDSTMMVDG